jgi:pilus assembly protein CpaE
MVGRVLQLLVTMYDVVVVDTAGRFDDFALQAFDHSDVVLLMGTLDMPALKGLKLAVETFDLLNLPRAKWRLVLNRADSKVGLSTDEVEKTLKVKIATAIPSSREVPACINRGDVIVRAQPRHPVSQTIRQLAGQLVAIDGVEVHASPAHSAPEHRRSLFRRKVRSS